MVETVDKVMLEDQLSRQFSQASDKIVEAPGCLELTVDQTGA